jgi:hypothetical protein
MPQLLNIKNNASKTRIASAIVSCVFLSGCEADLEPLLEDLAQRHYKMTIVANALQGYGYSHSFEQLPDGVIHSFSRPNGCQFEVLEGNLGVVNSFNFKSRKDLCTYTRSNLGLQ